MCAPQSGDWDGMKFYISHYDMHNSLTASTTQCFWKADKSSNARILLAHLRKVCGHFALRMEDGGEGFPSRCGIRLYLVGRLADLLGSFLGFKLVSWFKKSSEVFNS